LCYQTIRLVSGALEHPEDDTVMEKHSANALYSAVESLMHASGTEDHDAAQNAAYRIIQISNRRINRTWSALKLANGTPLVWIKKENAQCVDLEWTELEAT